MYIEGEMVKIIDKFKELISIAFSCFLSLKLFSNWIDIIIFTLLFFMVIFIILCWILVEIDVVFYKDKSIELSKKYSKMKSERDNLEYKNKAIINHFSRQTNFYHGNFKKLIDGKYSLWVSEKEYHNGYYYYDLTILGIYENCKSRLLSIIPDKKEMMVSIDDLLPCPQDKGFGTMLLDFLKEFVREQNYKGICGNLANVDLQDHEERLLHFYKKNDFDIHYDENSKPMSISWKLPKISKHS